jgi:hypothetical protein
MAMVRYAQQQVGHRPERTSNWQTKLSFREA